MRVLALTTLLGLGAAAAVVGGGCSTVYYNVWESLGKEKRDLLKDNVEKAKDDQEDVQEEFKDALAHLKSLYGLNGGELEKTYELVRADYDSAQARAKALRERIAKVDSIANDLFVEWETEAKSMHNATYRKDSLKKLGETKAKFEAMSASMKRSEKAIEPVMVRLNDQVLYLKHNLNAQALGSLKGEVGSIEKEIAKLMKDMQRSIAAADDFIETLEPKNAPST